MRAATQTWSPPSGGPAGPPGLARRIAALIIGVLLLAGSAFGLLPAMKRLGPIGPAVELLENSGIEAGAFWYANVEKVGVAERYIASLDLIHEAPGRSSGTDRGR